MRVTQLFADSSRKEIERKAAFNFRRFLAFFLAAAQMLVLLGCQTPQEPDPGEETYEFLGQFMSDGELSAVVDAAFRLTLEMDGSAVLDKYAVSCFDSSPADSNPTYYKGFMTGTWKHFNKDGEKCLQIKLTAQDNKSTTYYATMENGRYSFMLSYSVVIGLISEEYQCSMTENKTPFAGADAFIQAYKKAFIEPEHIAKIVDNESDGTLYFFDDGQFSVYYGYNTLVTGQWGKDETGVTIVIGADKYELISDGGRVGFSYQYSLPGYQEYSFVFELPDISVLPDRSRNILASGERDYSTVPDPLLFMDGTPVVTEEDFDARRNEIVSLFAEHVYGTLPTEGFTTEFSVVEEGSALEGTAERKQVKMTITTEKGSVDAMILVYLPVSEPEAPVIVELNYSGNHTVLDDNEILPSVYDANTPVSQIESERGKDLESLPVRDAISKGYGVCTLCYNDIAVDSREYYSEGLISLFDDSDFRALSAWAFAMMRCVDYLESCDTVDASKIVFAGHSRLGKAATWAAAVDTRVCLLISNCSGSAGSSMTRGNQGENLEDVTTFFPYWLSPKYAEYAGKENNLPVDQNLLLACMADRYLCVGNAENDGSADPYGAWMAVKFAANAFEMFGDSIFDLSYFESHEFESDVSFVSDRISYHLRAGNHSFSNADWAYYFEFMDEKLE